MNSEYQSTNYSRHPIDKTTAEGFPHYFQSPSACMAGVFNAACESRCAALEVLYRHWCLDTRFLTELMIEMLRDPEEDVRGWAGGLLAELAEGTCDVLCLARLHYLTEDRDEREG